jgi:hypothetical protein
MILMVKSARSHPSCISLIAVVPTGGRSEGKPWICSAGRGLSFDVKAASEQTLYPDTLRRGSRPAIVFEGSRLFNL